MFAIPKDELIANLGRLRQRVCLYGTERCDCKYGATGGHTEQTGCPELRLVIALLNGEVVTDDGPIMFTIPREEVEEMLINQKVREVYETALSTCLSATQETR